MNYQKDGQGAEVSQFIDDAILTSHNQHGYESCYLQPCLPEWCVNKPDRCRHRHVVLLNKQQQFFHFTHKYVSRYSAIAKFKCKLHSQMAKYFPILNKLDLSAFII